MIGQQPRTDSLFYYFRLEDQIPNGHLLKRLDRFIDFGFVRERLRDTYSAVGRPSIDPEVLLRLHSLGSGLQSDDSRYHSVSRDMEWMGRVEPQL
jgi:transposase